MTTNNTTNDSEFPPLPPSPKTAKSPTTSEKAQVENSTWETVRGKGKKASPPKKTAILPPKKASYRSALTVKSIRSPKRPKPTSPPQGTAAVRKLNPSVVIKQEFMSNAGIVKGFAPIFQPQNDKDLNETNTTPKHTTRSSTQESLTIPSGKKDKSMTKQRVKRTGAGKRDRGKKIHQKRC